MRDGLSSTSKVDDAPATAPSRTIRPDTGPGVGALERHWGGRGVGSYHSTSWWRKSQ